MNKDIDLYFSKLSKIEKEICTTISDLINSNLLYTENKIWHAHPVWFINGNPIVGISSQKQGIRLMFWSGRSFEEKDLTPGSGKFKDASIFYNSKDEINISDIKRWLEKAALIQWDYKNIVKRKGKLIKI